MSSDTPAKRRLEWRLPMALVAASFVAFAPARDARADSDTARPDDDRGTFSFVIENDAFGGGTDRNYTSGVMMSYLSKPLREPGFGRWLGETLLGAGPDDRVHVGLGLGHSIFTPQDIKIATPLPDQHPYAGWAYLSLPVLVDTGYTLKALVLDLGLVGPDAGGEYIQRKVHEIIDSDDPKGWDNQLRNEVGVVLSYEHKWRALAEWDLTGLGIDITPSIGLSAGNVLTQAAGGLMLRVGTDLANDYGPARVRPGLAGFGFYTPRDSFSWYLFAGVGGRAVAYNIFLDGNTRTDSPEVDRRPFVADFQGGLVLQLKRVQLGFTLVTRTEEFESQDEDQVFGSISIGIKL